MFACERQTSGWEEMRCDKNKLTGGETVLGQLIISTVFLPRELNLISSVIIRTRSNLLIGSLYLEMASFKEVHFTSPSLCLLYLSLSHLFSLIVSPLLCVCLFLSLVVSDAGFSSFTFTLSSSFRFSHMRYPQPNSTKNGICKTKTRSYC